MVCFCQAHENAPAEPTQDCGGQLLLFHFSETQNAIPNRRPNARWCNTVNAVGVLRENTNTGFLNRSDSQNFINARSHPDWGEGNLE